MPVKVIDASALAAVVFAEPKAEEVVSRIQDCTLAAPALLPFEMARSFLKKLHRYPEQRSLLLAAYRMSGRMEIKQTDVDLNAVIAFAEQERITVYDATYLWLSHRLGAEIVTLDKKLAEAAVES